MSDDSFQQEYSVLLAFPPHYLRACAMTTIDELCRSKVKNYNDYLRSLGKEKLLLLNNHMHKQDVSRQQLQFTLDALPHKNLCKFMVKENLKIPKIREIVREKMLFDLEAQVATNKRLVDYEDSDEEDNNIDILKVPFALYPSSYVVSSICEPPTKTRKIDPSLTTSSTGPTPPPPPKHSSASHMFPVPEDDVTNTVDNGDTMSSDSSEATNGSQEEPVEPVKPVMMTTVVLTEPETVVQKSANSNQDDDDVVIIDTAEEIKNNSEICILM